MISFKKSNRLRSAIKIPRAVPISVAAITTVTMVEVFTGVGDFGPSKYCLSMFPFIVAPAVGLRPIRFAARFPEDTEDMATALHGVPRSYKQ
jgi:hypothetical protein